MDSVPGLVSRLLVDEQSAIPEVRDAIMTILNAIGVARAAAQRLHSLRYCPSFFMRSLALTGLGPLAPSSQHLRFDFGELPVILARDVGDFGNCLRRGRSYRT